MQPWLPRSTTTCTHGYPSTLPRFALSVPSLHLSLAGTSSCDSPTAQDKMVEPIFVTPSRTHKRDVQETMGQGEEVKTRPEPKVEIQVSQLTRPTPVLLMFAYMYCNTDGNRREARFSSSTGRGSTRKKLTVPATCSGCTSCCGRSQASAPWRESSRRTRARKAR